mmetsp:Transcript_31670/g.40700  ORF Transcript_31670/g.40700 Transcript_31670/m.40700 type:complete len:655 (-) Transcript_31670:164-2128(-)
MLNSLKRKKTLIKEVRKLRSDEASARAAAQVAQANAHQERMKNMTMSTPSIVNDDDKNDNKDDNEKSNTKKMEKGRTIREGQHSEDKDEDRCEDEEKDEEEEEEEGNVPQISIDIDALIASTTTRKSAQSSNSTTSPIYDARTFRRELRVAIAKAIKLSKPDDLPYTSPLSSPSCSNSSHQIVEPTTSEATTLSSSIEMKFTKFKKTFIPTTNVSNESMNENQMNEKSKDKNQKSNIHLASSSPSASSSQKDTFPTSLTIPSNPDCLTTSDHNEEEEEDEEDSYFRSFLPTSMLGNFGFAANEEPPPPPPPPATSSSPSPPITNGNNNTDQSIVNPVDTNKQQPKMRHEFGRFGYRVTYLGGVWVRPSPDNTLTFKTGFDIIRRGSYFISLERRIDLNTNFVYVRVGGGGSGNENEDDDDDKTYVDESIVGWVFETSLKKDVILMRDENLQQIDYIIEPQNEPSPLMPSTQIGEEGENDSKNEDMIKEKQTDEEKTINNTTSIESPSSITNTHEQGGNLSKFSGFLPPSSSSSTATTLNGNIGRTPISWPINSWECVFHSKKIGVEFKKTRVLKEGESPKIAVSKASGLVTFGPNPQKMPTVGAILVGCNDIDLQDMHWKNVAECLKDATERPLKLRFVDPESTPVDITPTVQG